MTAARTSSPDAAAAELAHALRALGVHARVEARGRLALLAAEDAAPLADPAVRRRVATLAAAGGFTHVALELDLPSDRS